MSKSANYRIRVEPGLHQAFLDVCQQEDRPAAQVVREFMKAYVVQHQADRSPDLSAPASNKTSKLGK